MAADEKPYTVHSRTKITLHPEALYWAKEHGYSSKEELEQFAQYLLTQHHSDEGAGDKLDAPLGLNKPVAEPAAFMQPEQSFNPLANALGYGDVGNIQT
jgi:hypothetical protein